MDVRLPNSYCGELQSILILIFIVFRTLLPPLSVFFLPYQYLAFPCSVFNLENIAHKKFLQHI